MARLGPMGGIRKKGGVFHDYGTGGVKGGGDPSCHVDGQAPTPQPETGRETGLSDEDSRRSAGHAHEGKGGGTLSCPGQGGRGSPARFLERGVGYPLSYF